MSNDIFKSKEFKDNLNTYETAMKSGSPFYLEADELTDIAEYYHMHGRTEDALNTIETALQMFPGATQPLAFRARAAILMGHNARLAMKYVDMIDDKQDLDYYYIVAEVMIADNRIDDAEDYLQHKKEEIDEDDMEDYCLDVATLFADYDVYDLSQEWLDMCEDDDEDDYLELKGRICLSRSQTKEAKTIYNALIDRNPYENNYWNGLASAQYMESRYNDSIDSSDFSLAIDPDDTDAIINKANSLMMLANYDDAYTLYQHYIELQPQSEVGYMGVAAIMMSRNKLAESLRDWKKAERCCPKHSVNLIDIYRNICLVEASMGQFDQSFKYIDKIEHFSFGKSADVNVLRGYIMLLAGRRERADKEFLFALKKTSARDKDNTLFFIAYCYFDCNYMKEANTIFRRLTSSVRSDDFTDLWAYLLRTDYELGLQSEFLADLKEATAHNPDSIERELPDFFPSGMTANDFYNYAITHPINRKNK